MGRQLDTLWTIGTPDGNDVQFALAPDGWDKFREKFPDDVVFVVGRSDARSDWPYVHPGPADAWAGSRRHTAIVFFGLSKASQDDCRLVVDLVDTHSAGPPKWRIRINDWSTERRLPRGAGDDSIEGNAAAGRPCHLEIPVPAAALKAGNNALAIESLDGSWAIYDAIRFEGPAEIELAPVTPQTTIGNARGAGVLLKKPDGALLQPLEIAILHTGDPVKAVVDAGGASVPVQLRAGRALATISAPAVERPTTLAIHVRADGKTLAERSVEVKPVRQWVVYLLPHSHNDIGYTAVQTEVEQRQWANLELAIDTARKTAAFPEGARFRWNVEVMWAIDGYLRQASPKKQQAFIDAVKAGWIELDALYGNELTGLCRPEELVHLMDCAGRVARRCGVPLETAMISDVPGYTWGLVPTLAQAGVKYFSIGPNFSDRIGRTLAEWGDKPFYWESPSGQQRVLCWMAGLGYSFFHRGSLEKIGAGPILEYLAELERSGYPYDLVQMRYNIGGDNGPPDPAVCEFVRDWNQHHVSPRFVVATTSEMCREFERRYGETIPRVRGDFTPYWEDGAASSARETAVNRAAAERLTQAETLFALLGADRYPADEFERAWRNVILYDEHTWGAWNSISEPDAPFVKQQWAIKQGFALDAQRQSTTLLQTALNSENRSAPPAPAIDVINTSSWPRTGLVTAPAECAEIGDQVKDADGRIVPSQRLSDGELVFLARDVPALGVKRYTIAPGEPTAAGDAAAAGLSVSTRALSVRIDEKTGAIASLRSRLLDREWVDAHAPIALNDYRYMLGSDAAGAMSNGPPTITVAESGPLVASLRIESAAPGCRRLVREVRLVDGLDAVEISDTVDKTPVREKEGVHIGFAFDVPDGVVRINTAWAVIRPDVDQLPGACRNWFTVQRWVDISNAQCGVTWATLDAPLVEIGSMTADRIGSLSNPEAWLDHVAPSQTLYSWVMNNHWHTNYRAEQEGPVTFRYVIRPHAAFDYSAAHRMGIERSQPLIARPVAKTAPTPEPLLRLDPAEPIVVASLRPTDDKRGCIVRLFNPSDQPARTNLRWSHEPPRRICRCDLLGVPGAPAAGEIELPPWGVLAVRCDQFPRR